MIERYSRKVMRDVWTEENKFSAYLEVEILSCEAWSKLGVIPAADVEKIQHYLINPVDSRLTDDAVPETLEMKTQVKNFTGWTAQIIQHEVDHCNGILI